MNLLRKGHFGTRKADEYATSADFRKLFTEEMASLYLLSFLLTANHEKAEQCFVDGLEACVKGTFAFKEWARSWAKRMILKNAIRIMAPHPNRASDSLTGIHPRADGRRQTIQDQHPAIASVLTLEDFDRFVFVMSVLERYTENECSVLLGCSQQDVREARMRAQRQIVDDTMHDGAGEGDSIQFSRRSPEML